ncbi:MAG: asparagine synthase (glutamine-hydrolyzing) [Peptococcaceae bacterium]|jgi:asparagine synthase (glutamine-hydrolysing)|nr:asparagine synthase (glutamine-hydrolyzing) [Peptococcaceae bacterium]MDH7526360.1 asparagine synthase (glutamine-hydrolyzing) [Peptococcaceae bacterium]
MCGITGWVDWEKDLTHEKPIIEKMMNTLTMRGPDDSGTWISKHAAFGHRRLSVVDPAGGAQPMVRQRSDKKYVICYNGELYNTPELRNELLRRGYVFYGHSDTEVLLYSYMEWGEHCLERLNGIFAFAVWDDAEQKLLLARDRLGVKPLFYTVRNRSLIFGSELKALLAHPHISPVVGEEGLAEVLIMGPARTPGHGIYEGIREIRPGCFLTFNLAGVRHKRYWSLKSAPHPDKPFTTAEKLRTMLQDIVERQLVSDVPVCTLLSGGIDSSALTVFAANAFRERGMDPLDTYSIDYKDNERYFEASRFQPNADPSWATRVSAHLGTNHHQVIIDTSELVSALREATLAKDLPGQADIDSSLYLFCREVKKGATVALSGECADEIFGGYPWFHDEENLKRPMFPWVRFLEHRVSLWNKNLFKSFEPAEYVTHRYNETLSEVPALNGEEPLEARHREMFYLNMNWFMQALLDRKDRMSMASGLEVRVPFADHHLVEYVWNIPWKLKAYGNMAKGILRLALKGLLPSDVLGRKKSPYPKTHNPSYTQAVRSWLGDILNDPSQPLHDVINRAKVEELFLSPEDIFNQPFFGQLMCGPQMMAYLIQVNTWLKEYKVIIK